MCDASAATMAMSGGSLLMQAGGQYQASRAQAAMARYQGQVAEYNAGLAEQDAIYRQQSSDYDILERYRDLKHFMGTQRTAMAVSGVEVNSGTPLEVLASTEAMGQRDIHLAQIQGERDVWNARLGAQHQRIQAKAYSLEKRAAEQAGFWTVGNSLLRSGSKLTDSALIALKTNRTVKEPLQ